MLKNNHIYNQEHTPCRFRRAAVAALAALSLTGCAFEAPDPAPSPELQSKLATTVRSEAINVARFVMSRDRLPKNIEKGMLYQIEQPASKTEKYSAQVIIPYPTARTDYGTGRPPATSVPSELAATVTDAHLFFTVERRGEDGEMTNEVDKFISLAGPDSIGIIPTHDTWSAMYTDRRFNGHDFRSTANWGTFGRPPEDETADNIGTPMTDEEMIGNTEEVIDIAKKDILSHLQDANAT